MTRILLLLLFFSLSSYSQTLNLNNTFIEKNLRISQLNGDIDESISFTIRPLHINNYDIKSFNIENYAPTVFSFLNKKGKFKILPLDYNITFNSHHPYNRNNG